MLISKSFTKYAKMFINYLIKLLKHKKGVKLAREDIYAYFGSLDEFL